MTSAKRAEVRRARRAGKPGVYLGYVHPDQVDSAWHGCMMQLIWHDALGPGHVINPTSGGYINVGSGPRIANARNTVVSRFLDQNAEWLLMLDTDMTFGPDLVDRLLEVADPEKVPIVGGLCFAGGKGAQHFPTIYHFFKDEDGELVAARAETYPENQLIEVSGTGAACLLMHRDALEKIGETYAETGAPWFAETYAFGQEFGEDLCFCVRATRIGIPIHVHTGIELGHRKLHVLNSETYAAQRAEVAALGEDAYRQRHVGALGLTETEVRVSA